MTLPAEKKQIYNKVNIEEMQTLVIFTVMCYAAIL